MPAEPSEALFEARPFEFGRVESACGSKVGVAVAREDQSQAGRRVSVGAFVEISAGARRLVGVVTEVSSRHDRAEGAADPLAVANLDLMGEFLSDSAGTRRFERGVSSYPAIGDAASLVDRESLQLIFSPEGPGAFSVGRLGDDDGVPVALDIDNMLSKHFAVLGSTGVGKSSGVAVILREVLKRRPNLRVFLLDVHNEYGCCFGDRAQILNGETLRIPFWLFAFEELVDILFGGRPAVDEETDILAELIPMAKSLYLAHRSGAAGGVRKFDPRTTGFTVDTPVPYLMQDLVALIDERMGKLESRTTRMHFHRLLARIEAIRGDGRYAFMFENANVGGDTMADILARVFRLEPNGKPMTVMQVAGFPAEATDALVCVLCRLAFDFGLWSDGASPMAFVCEEAHRFASADRSVGFAPTRRALLRTAKEGRKYGVYLGLVTQRPAELDPTIISQCNTLFAMRLPNDRDQALLRSAVSDAAANLLSFLPSLGTREVIGFGEGLPMPARLRFHELPPELAPRSDAFFRLSGGAVDVANKAFLRTVIERWRGATNAALRPSEDVENVTPEPPPQSSGMAPLTTRMEHIRAQLSRR